MAILPFHGFGLGLRKQHYSEFLETRVPVDFVEVISENFMVDGGRPRRILRQVREKYPVILHGVSLSVGSIGGVDLDYLRRLRKLVDEVEPLFVSDHLCWTRTTSFNSHDLLPLPFNGETLAVVTANVLKTQDVLGREILLENPSSYLNFTSEMKEWEFLGELCARTGCGLLLDVNNVYVSACNNGFDAIQYLDGLFPKDVYQIHLAGHSKGTELLIDTHDQEVPDSVWQLYRHVLPKLGPVATMIERDDAIPELSELLSELDTARFIAGSFGKAAA